ncbi:MAG: histidine phosphatase family protein [Chloroflexi bacterium]|nr:histidine phosphatase family protein [Chloroflexota bacterium]
MHLYLIRHGQSYINLADYGGGHRNEPLTDLGEKQAEAVAAWIKDNIQARHLYCSTMMRTRQTAAAIIQTTGLAAQYDDRIREVGTAYPNGSPVPDDQLKPYFERVWGTLQPYDPITESGENWMQFRTRVGSFIESLLRTFAHIDYSTRPTPEEEAEQSVLVVCHGGVIEAFFEYVFEKGPWSVVAVMSNNTGMTHLEYRPVADRPAWRLHFHNKLVHLTSDLIS